MFEGELAWNKVRRRFSNDFHNAVIRLSARNDMPFPFETQPITEGEPVTLWNGEDSNTQRGLSSYMDMDLKKRDKLVPDNWSDWCDGRRSITWDGVPQSIESHAAHSFSHRSKVFFFSLSLFKTRRKNSLATAIISNFPSCNSRTSCIWQWPWSDEARGFVYIHETQWHLIRSSKSRRIVSRASLIASRNRASIFDAPVTRGLIETVVMYLVLSVWFTSFPSIVCN